MLEVLGITPYYGVYNLENFKLKYNIWAKKGLAMKI